MAGTVSVFLAIPILREIQPLVLDSILHAGSGLVTNAHVESDYSKFLDDKRNDCVEAFLKTDCTHLLFWDSDTLADANAIKILADHDKPVVSAVIYQKGGDHAPCFGYWDEATRAYGTPMPFQYDKLIQVDIAGTGFLMIKREVFEKVKYPWFECGEKGQSGEDIYFCVKCKEAGIPIFVDTGLHLGHVATPYVVTNETYEMSLYWKMIRGFKEEGRLDLFRELLFKFIKRTPEEIEVQTDPSNAFRLVRGSIGYKPSEGMRSAYLEYVKEVSKPEWAISWQLACFLDKTIHQLKPKRMLDLGSGFSSFVFRSNNAEVISADKDPKWLERTREFLSKHKLSADNVIEGFDKIEGEFDLILLDYAIEDRVALFKFAREHGKVIVLDDMHFKLYREAAAEFFKDDLVFDLKEETMDTFGRYSWMIIPMRA